MELELELELGLDVDLDLGLDLDVDVDLGLDLDVDLEFACVIELEQGSRGRTSWHDHQDLLPADQVGVVGEHVQVELEDLVAVASGYGPPKRDGERDVVTLADPGVPRGRDGSDQPVGVAFDLQ